MHKQGEVGSPLCKVLPVGRLHLPGRNEKRSLFGKVRVVTKSTIHTRGYSKLLNKVFQYAFRCLFARTARAMATVIHNA